MTPQEAARFVRQIAETTAIASQNWENFQAIVESLIISAMEAGRKYGRDEARLAAQETQMDWQPIATAPKDDGVLVLLYPSRCWSEEAEPYDCEVGYWDEYTKTWEGAGSKADDYTGPTHWRPLPPKPRPKKKRARLAGETPP